MADTTLKIRNPEIKRLFDTVAGHDHDGTNSKSVTGGSTPADLSVTNAKLAADVKVGSLAALTTTEKTNVVGAINEIVTTAGGAVSTANGAVVTANAASAAAAAAASDAATASAAAASASAAVAAAATETGTETLTNKTLTTPIIASIYQDAGKTKLMTLPDTASDTLVTLAATQTLTGKTLTSPTITTMLIDDSDTGVTVTSADQTHAAPTVTIPDIGDAADEFVMKDTTQTLTLKTLTSPVLNTPLLGDGDTGVTITSADQTHAAPTVTIPDIGDAADSFCMIDTAQTLTNKTLTAPVITGINAVDAISAHDYGATATAWTLSAAEIKTGVLSVTNASGAADIIAPDVSGRGYWVVNEAGFTITLKVTGQTGVAVGDGKVAYVKNVGGGDYIRFTADA